MKILDTKRKKCPQPLIMVREALEELQDGEQVTIYIDNDTSLKNLLTYLKEQGAEPEVTTSGKVHTVVTGKPKKSMTGVEPSAYIGSVNLKDYVVCIRSDLMGSGDPELGKALMESFVDNLKLQECLPTHVVLYNSGVRLAMKQSPVCASLSELEELGTRIMLCGTCIDHFGIQYDLGVGMISNMVSITGTLASAGHVIYP